MNQGKMENVYPALGNSNLKKIKVPFTSPHYILHFIFFWIPFDNRFL